MESISKHAIEAPTRPPAGKTIIVERTGDEGALVLDGHTGQITTPNDERPDWADGLAVGMLAERHGWYHSRLGTELYTPKLQHPDILNYDDLSWLGVDEDGSEREIEASTDYRMERLSEIIGFNQETGEHTKGTVLAEVEIGLDIERTPEQMAAFEQSQTAEAQTGT